MERVILDTTVLIAAERGKTSITSLIREDDDVAMAAVTAAELLVGVELAPDKNRSAREVFVEELLEIVPVEDYDLSVARAHAHLLAESRRQGRPRGAHDLMIAATAAARDRTVVTADAEGFADLPGVKLRS